MAYAQIDQSNNNNNKSDNFIEANNLISVTIGGNSPITGTFRASMTERVDQFVTRIFNEAKILKLDPKFYSIRDVLLKHSDGKEIKVDLERFHLNGNFVNNPYLKNDDVLIFPPVDIVRNFFSVAGAVNNPGVFSFVDGDKLKDAIEFAGGINKAFENVTKANIFRLSYDGKDEKMIKVDINGDFNLERGDRIIAIADQSMKKDFSIKIIGEVNNPGYIPITKDRTTLYEVLVRAGGLTSNASLKFARIYSANSYYALLEGQFGLGINSKFPSKSLESGLMENLVRVEDYNLERMSPLVPEDTSYFKMENNIRILTEHSGVDFTKLDDPNSEVSKHIMKDNDLIIIPAKENTIYVFGQVPNQGHITLVPGKDYKYYIEKAGGFGEYAEKGDVMVIKGNSNQWISADKNPMLEEGDYIYIPRSTARSLNSYISQIGGYLGIAASVATVILLLYQFKK